MEEVSIKTSLVKRKAIENKVLFVYANWYSISGHPTIVYLHILSITFLKDSIFKSTSKICTCIFVTATYITNVYLDICDSDEFIVSENYILET